ncbi:phosducin-like protein [Gigantopelta aegis]|uniref:phosducin-like protein n=1 Tax=Gigantopelta aegis TaxID=1735272 RepID=UPI001B88D16F|nr:phosducin-like protein [Gigantopelta aegis]
MAVSFDDKLLGEKAQYYCSSSEDEGEEEEDDGEGRDKSATKQTVPSVSEPTIGKYQGYCTNTGPKGVMTDWREFKRLETEKREDQEKQKLELAKKLSLTCRSHLNDDKASQEDSIPETLILSEFEDEFLKEYRRRRIAEMAQALQRVPTFGKLIFLQSSNEFLEAVDKENPQVTVIIHIFEENVASCKAMNGCLMCLAQEYPTVKFCRMKASTVRLSMNFTEKGLPALLIYKNGLMVGNFVRMSDEFGEDFFATEIESFLQEHGFLSSSSKDLNSVIRDKLPEDDDCDSDFDID